MMKKLYILHKEGRNPTKEYEDHLLIEFYSKNSEWKGGFVTSVSGPDLLDPKAFAERLDPDDDVIVITPSEKGGSAACMLNGSGAIKELKLRLAENPDMTSWETACRMIQELSEEEEDME